MTDVLRPDDSASQRAALNPPEGLRKHGIERATDNLDGREIQNGAKVFMDYFGDEFFELCTKK